LYVVNHGKRESVEVFTLDARVKPASLTWIGCVVAQDPIGLNSVIPLPDGGFIGTDYLERGANANAARTKMMAGESNGSLWEWHTGKGWKIIPATETSGANGLELSKDGKTLFVNAWGSQSFYRMQMGQTKRDTVQLGFRADNVRWAPDGSLLVVGQGGGANGQAQTTNVVKIHPTTLKVTEVLTRPNSPEFRCRNCSGTSRKRPVDWFVSWRPYPDCSGPVIGAQRPSESRFLTS
jgi:sugar lactone lactonase YvrE